MKRRLGLDTSRATPEGERFSCKTRHGLHLRRMTRDVSKGRRERHTGDDDCRRRRVVGDAEPRCAARPNEDTTAIGTHQCTAAGSPTTARRASDSTKSSLSLTLVYRAARV